MAAPSRWSTLASVKFESCSPESATIVFRFSSRPDNGRLATISMNIFLMPSRLSSLLVMLVAATASAGELRILPAEFTLHGSKGRQQLAVVAMRQDRYSATLPSDQVELRSSDPTVVGIQGGIAVAMGNGQAEIVAVDRQGNEASARVHVEHAGEPHRWSFRNEVQSVFSKVGCNQGACHGALAGKGGFKLSLRGYDIEADYLTITREARGRRIEMADPGRSLILAKPTGALPHKGGLKLSPDSRDYEIVSQWIANGAHEPGPTIPVCLTSASCPNRLCCHPEMTRACWSALTTMTAESSTSLIGPSLRLPTRRSSMSIQRAS